MQGPALNPRMTSLASFNPYPVHLLVILTPIRTQRTPSGPYYQAFKMKRRGLRLCPDDDFSPLLCQIRERPDPPFAAAAGRPWLAIPLSTPLPPSLHLTTSPPHSNMLHIHADICIKTFAPGLISLRRKLTHVPTITALMDDINTTQG